MDGSEVLKTARKVWRLGVHGKYGTGKTDTYFSFADDFGLIQADDDDHIRDTFAHWKKMDGGEEAIEKLVAAPIEKRRRVLAEALKILVLDWDNKGAEELFAGLACHISLMDSFRYKGIANWGQAHRMLTDALEELQEHSDKGWGPMGCVLVIDNMQSAWGEAASDYTRAKSGMTYEQTRSLARRKVPGKDSDARSAQSKILFEEIDWKEVSDAHKEWFQPALECPFNIILCAPSKTRVEKGVDQWGNETITEETQLGGARQLLLDMQYILWKTRDPAMTQFFGHWHKTRFSGLTPPKVVNPTFTNIRKSVEHMKKLQLTEKRALYERKKFAENLGDLGFDISLFAKPREGALMKIEEYSSPVAKLPPPPPVPGPMPAAPMPLPPMPTNGGLQALPPAPPPMMSPMPTPPVMPPPPMVSMTAPPPPTPAVEAALPPPPPKFEFSKAGFLQMIKSYGQVSIADLEEYPFDIEEFDYDQAEEFLNKLLDDGLVFERELGHFVEVDNPAPPPPPEVKKSKSAFKSIKPAITPVGGDTVYIVGAFDKERGSYHRPGCGMTNRMKETREVTDPGENRAPCKKCKPDQANTEDVVKITNPNVEAPTPTVGEVMKETPPPPPPPPKIESPEKVLKAMAAEAPLVNNSEESDFGDAGEDW